MKALYKPENEMEAIALQALLEEHSITVFVQSFHDSVYDGLYQNQHGWGVIRVDENDYDEAQKLVNNWKSALPDNDEIPMIYEQDLSQNELASHDAPSESKKPHVLPVLFAFSLILNLIALGVFMSSRSAKQTGFDQYDMAKGSVP